MPKILSKSFYQRQTEIVAQELLGKNLVHIVNGTRLAGTIVETEAYMGIEDRACHTYGNRRTPRTEAMFLPGGYSYVYLIYGIYFCFNVVTSKKDQPEAVLIRAVEPTEGLDIMRRLRKTKSDRDLTNGPGKLCMAMSIHRSCNGLPLTRSPLFIEDGPDFQISGSNVIRSPRVGVDYAGECALRPLRFSIKDNPFVSKPRPET